MMRKFLIIVFFLLVLPFSSCYGTASAVQSAGFKECTVHATSLNIRSGPSSSYKVVKTVPKETKLIAHGRIYGWYLVQTADNTFGMVNGWYITPVTASAGSGSSSNNNATTTSGMTSDEKKIFDLVNEARREAGLSELKSDPEILRVAKIKSKDMIDNNYFSHNSPIYGTPFQMLKNFGISYRAAGENIAGNSSVEAAFKAWMNSSGHKANILSDSFNYTGIGIVEGSKYGKIFTQVFVGR